MTRAELNQTLPGLKGQESAKNLDLLLCREKKSSLYHTAKISWERFPALQLNFWTPKCEPLSESRLLRVADGDKLKAGGHWCWWLNGQNAQLSPPEPCLHPASYSREPWRWGESKRWHRGMSVFHGEGAWARSLPQQGRHWVHSAFCPGAPWKVSVLGLLIFVILFSCYISSITPRLFLVLRV